ncbi:hypothetical protein [Clostridium beijerinckii]|uniref:hypothetical protein n=1 Tax=Clostridium beijerinckii TaxID=1520 RepID=UPI00047A0B31|nr:hypothetical protein [Clostridium beijerinckii]
MNLITETKRRLEYIKKELEELKAFSEIYCISGIAREHLNSEISKTENNIKYYSEILEKLEEK